MRDLCGLLLPNVPDPELLIARCGNDQGTVGAPGQRLYNVPVLEGKGGGTRLDVPDFDCVVARRRCKDILGRRVEENMTYFPIGSVSRVQSRRTCATTLSDPRASGLELHPWVLLPRQSAS